FLLPHYAHLRALPSFPTRRSSDLQVLLQLRLGGTGGRCAFGGRVAFVHFPLVAFGLLLPILGHLPIDLPVHGFALGGIAFLFRGDRKSTRLNSSHLVISYAVFCLK